MKEYQPTERDLAEMFAWFAKLELERAEEILNEKENDNGNDAESA